MADTDNSSYIIRYNLTDNNLEYFQGADWYTATAAIVAGITQLHGDVTAGPGVGNQLATVVSTAAVKTLHADSHSNLTGNVQLVSGTNISLSQVGQAITVNATGSGPTPNVVQAIHTDSSSTTSATPQATGLTVTITPSSSSSTVRVRATFNIVTQTAGSLAYATLLNGSHNIAPLIDGNTQAFTALMSSTGDHIAAQQSIDFIDSPATTSPVTYTVAIFNNDGVNDVIYNYPTVVSTIIAEEILA